MSDEQKVKAGERMRNMQSKSKKDKEDRETTIWWCVQENIVYLIGQYQKVLDMLLISIIGISQGIHIQIITKIIIMSQLVVDGGVL